MMAKDSSDCTSSADDNDAAALPRAVLEAAAQWHSVMDGAPSAQEARAFEQWRAENADHERAWQHMQALWALLATPAELAPAPRLGDLLRGTADRRRRRRRNVKRTALLFAALLPAWWAIQTQLPWLGAELNSGVGEQRRIELSDGSRLTLNTDSAVDVIYTARERRIVLRQGEILAEVARGQLDRPFVVATRDGSATALGTRYLVRLLPDATRVTVTESRVKACPARPGADCQDAEAGQTLDIRPDAVGPLRTAPRDVEGWSQGRLSVSDTPLPEVLEELARHRRGLLLYDAQALADLRVSAVLPLEGDAALASLQENLPIRIRRYGPWLQRVERR